MMALTLSACASMPDRDDQEAVAAYNEANDPLEPMNRYFFEVNRFLDQILLRPVAEIYRGTLPDPVQDSVRNALDNLRGPVIFANDLLQGEVNRAGTTVGRFAVNSTIGVFGLFDVADSWFGLEKHNEDFGQTFAVWGIPEGPYLVVPVLGPSSPRKLAGTALEYYVDPWNNWLRRNEAAEFIMVRSAVDAVDYRARNLETLDDIERNAIDFYATLRSLYRQRRGDEIRNGAPAPLDETATISFEFQEDLDAETISEAAAE